MDLKAIFTIESQCLPLATAITFVKSAQVLEDGNTKGKRKQVYTKIFKFFVQTKTQICMTSNYFRSLKLETQLSASPLPFNFYFLHNSVLFNLSAMLTHMEDRLHHYVNS